MTPDPAVAILGVAKHTRSEADENRSNACRIFRTAGRYLTAIQLNMKGSSGSYQNGLKRHN